jgi:hypothetical protein
MGSSHPSAEGATVSVTRGGNHAVVVTEEDEAAVVEQLLA